MRRPSTTTAPAHPQPASRLPGAVAAAVVAAWLIAVAIGFTRLIDHGLAPGRAAAAPASWPGGTALALAHDRPTLVLFAHPHCPCTRATTAELERLLARAQRAPALIAVLFRDPAAPSDWSMSPVRSALAALPGARIVDDDAGALALRFGAFTSGTVALYAPTGHRLYHGGLTGARGHEGDNAGADAVLGWLADGAARTAAPSAPVYGCALHDEPAQAAAR